MTQETLVRVAASGRKPFCAGLILRDGRCVRCAPILAKWAMGRDAAALRAHIARMGWRASVVP